MTNVIETQSLEYRVYEGTNSAALWGGRLHTDSEEEDHGQARRRYQQRRQGRGWEPAPGWWASRRGHQGQQLGRQEVTAWFELFERVPREKFAPPVVWVESASGEWTRVDRETDPDDWAWATSADQPVVTQFDDGASQGA